MSTNPYFSITYRSSSCLNGGVTYRPISNEDDFSLQLLEEITDDAFQQPGRSYMHVESCATREELWMVPFKGNEEMLERLLDAMEIALPVGDCLQNLHFPVDVVEDQGQYAYLLVPMRKQGTAPIRTIMPNTEAPRWDAAINLFERVRELHSMGLTANGLSREQIRCNVQSGEVQLWLTERLSPVDYQTTVDNVAHGGFFSIPAKTESVCRKLGIRVEGTHRDIFSAAVAAFYLIICEHPFIGVQFSQLPRWMYLEQYHKMPDYVLRPGTDNHFGNMSSGILKRKQWEQTVPALQSYFNQLFLAVTDPVKYWTPEMDCWNPENWIEVLRTDKEHNDNESSRMHYDFGRSAYHIV